MYRKVGNQCVQEGGLLVCVAKWVISVGRFLVKGEHWT